MKKTKNKVRKEVLKEKNGYYYEFSPFYDALPDTLDVPEYRTEIFPRRMTHAEILSEYAIVPYQNISDAFAVIADCIPTLKKDCKGRLAYFADTDGTPCRLHVWRNDDGMLNLDVDDVSLDREWNAGDGVLASNDRSDARKEVGTLGFSPLGTLPENEPNLNESIGEAIDLLKENGFRIYKTEEVNTEY